MRILAVEPGPAFSVHDVHIGWVEAFRALGCDVQTVNLGDMLGFYDCAGRMTVDGQFVKLVPDDRGVVKLASKHIEAMCYEFWPDIVFVTSCFYLALEALQMMRRRGATVVINHLESPYEDDRQARRAEFADINLVNDPTNLDAFPSGTVYMPHAYRPVLHRPGRRRPELASDFAFVGTAFESRVRFFGEVDWSGIDVALGGNWSNVDEAHPLLKHVAHDLGDCLDNTQAVRLYQSTKTSANLYRREAERPELAAGWSCGPREIELAATGTWFARDSRPEGDALFPMLPTFTEPGELEEQIRWALAHPRLREAAARQARAAVADRTFEANARTLLRLVESK